MLNNSTKNEAAKKKNETISNKPLLSILHFFLFIFKTNKLLIILLTCLSAISSFIVALITLFIFKLVNQFLNTNFNIYDLEKYQNYSQHLNYPITLESLISILIITYFILLLISLWISSKLSTDFIVEFKKKIIKKILKLDIQYFSNNNPGDISYVSEACVSRCSSYPSIISKTIYNLILLILLSLILYGVSKIIFIFFSIVIIFFFFLFFLANRLSIYYNKKFIKIYSAINSITYELFDSIKIILQIKNLNVYTSKIFEIITSLKPRLNKHYIFNQTLSSFLNLSLLLSNVMIMYYVHQNSLENIYNITAFVITSFFAIKVFRALIDQLTNLLGLSVNYFEITRVLNLKEKKIKILKDNKDFNLKSINLKNISFKYKDQKNFLIEDLNIKFTLGKNYLIYGPSGSGKSTIFNLIYGSLVPNLGSIKINGNKDVNLLRDSLGYVTQDHFFINGTILENLKLFKSDIKEEEAIEILKLVDLNMSINALVGNQGKKLSGGQKSKITLARCLVNNPKVLLIDESLSAIDLLSRKKIISNLNALKKYMIQIYIAHDNYQNFRFDEKHFLHQGKLKKIN